jgi:uncharacterized membrane protein YgcG
VYEYELSYRTDRQLGFFADHDELYWNVTGNDWNFVIEKARATVAWPTVIPDEEIELTAYTGPVGATGTDFTAVVNESVATIETTRALSPGEGLTIVVGWPKGVVVAPTATASDLAKRSFWDNLPYLVGLLAFLAVLAYYYFTWRRIGVDPAARAIVPHYEPPQQLSPAAVRYINRMGADQTVLTASIINLAVHGYLKIEEVGKNYRLIKTGASEDDLSREEQALALTLFADAEEFVIENTNYQKIMEAQRVIAGSLKQIFKASYFVRNVRALMIGIGWSVVALALGLALMPLPDAAVAIFLTIFVALWTVGVVALAAAAWSQWRARPLTGAAFAFVLIIFGSVELGLLGIMFGLLSVFYTGYLLLLIILNIIFAYLLPRRTVAGARINDEIRGFKWFLEATEKDRLNFHNPPEATPELFEKFLPYALALDVGNEWGEQFEEVFSRLGPEGGYQPGWYAGSGLSTASVAGFSSGLATAFGGSIASSAQAPGSSSGFSGGSSGGGGGGGGGGGW